MLSIELLGRHLTLLLRQRERLFDTPHSACRHDLSSHEIEGPTINNGPPECLGVLYPLSHLQHPQRQIMEIGPACCNRGSTNLTPDSRKYHD